MNYILTGSRTGSTVFLHSLNQVLTRGEHYDIDALKPEVDSEIIGEHAHTITSWSVDEIIKANPIITVVKAEQNKFLELASHMTSSDKVIWFRRKNFNKWTRSVATRALTQTHHIVDSSDVEEYKTKLRPLRKREIQNAIDWCNAIEKRQRKILSDAQVICPTLYFEDFLETPQKTIERVLKFFNVWEDDMMPYCEKGIQTTCLQLPKYKQ